MACRFLKVKADLVYYVLRPSTENGYEDVAAALWAMFKHKSIRARDYALRKAASISQPGCTSDAEVFVLAHRILMDLPDDESVTSDDITRGLKPWVPTTIACIKQYSMGDRSSSVLLRLINRPLQDRYDSGGFAQSHLSYLLHTGQEVKEHEVLADGFCWLRSILMQLPKSRHGHKLWETATGNLLTGSSKAVMSHTQKGAKAFAPLLEELEAVSAALAQYIEINPRLLRDALREATLGTWVEDMTALEPNRAEYDFKTAIRWSLRGEYYLRLNNTNKRLILQRMKTEFREIPPAVITLVVGWVTTPEGAHSLLKAYQNGEWSLDQKMGMVRKKGSSQAMTIKDYAMEMLPDTASLQEMVQV